MKHHINFVASVLLTAVVFLFLENSRPPLAYAWFGRLACGRFVAGSYMVTITNENTGEIASRSLITFFYNHNMSVKDVADSVDASNFSDQHGTWKCTGRREISATTLSMKVPDSGVARLEYVIMFAGQGARAQKVKGTVELNLFSNPNADPFSDNTDRVQKFSLIGQRLTAD